MGYEIEHKGMLVEVTVSGGSPGRTYGPPEYCYPAEPPEVEMDSVSVSDWDEFVAWWGASGDCPTFAPTLAELLDRLTEREWDAICDKGLDAAANDEPDYEPPDDYDDDSYWDDHDIYGGGSYIGGDSDLMNEW